ncbi:UPF0157-domain-containing protein [Pseudovirgaria hyperparasitica]|uniref:UPF0157-domain-containing protein n=1 Tax=Pseudovirgaria hyperparasitica TaxID=470096 RepID=A0A6A6WJ55_9PEZI|nr:UPF0157-domain-containing protein [Pseudovirgaria hyperparasitica]KAF2762419.1 UPF0157-domain-containing protein [Pseudovirgaria hyperparasitica]
MAPIVVVPYDPAWPSQFEEIKASLEQILAAGSYLSIEHVGSTSVPLLPAKAIIDVDIVVKREALDSVFAALLEKGGYVYRGDFGVQDRHAFRHPELLPTRNVYVCVEGCLGLLNHLALRDVLRRDEALRKEYGDVKMELARQQLELNPYCDAKTEIVLKILAKAGFSEESMAQIVVMNGGPAPNVMDSSAGAPAGETVTTCSSSA